ncbi:hypothetical protein CWB59_12475 [Pseudoalteromonas sp. S326]|uniref:hypothetical protein n=1 Tax=Pseudoalteromonas sp. S326 TaxID=579533 RepID=UPI00110A9F0F|nr:hypothetical protein [Pseudoalteromonas sp. S326]TMO16729.1 hypothetical protein CWB59_12475 [Pseudoalteromonas sp. S326]
MAASAGAWYRVGTVNVSANSTNVAGIETAWENDVIAIAIGDAFTVDSKTWYEVIAVNGDTSITIDRPFEGSSESSKEYAILRNTSGTILTRLAGQIAVQFNQKQLFLDELRNWLTSEDETATLTDSHGIEHVVKTVNKIQEITGTAASRDVATNGLDATPDRVLKVGSGGLMAGAVSITNADDALLGSFGTSSQLTHAEAVAAGFPDIGLSDSTPVWWNIITWGSAARTSQVAIQIFRGSRQGLKFTRVKHDNIFSKWKLEKYKTVFSPGSGDAAASATRFNMSAIFFKLYVDLPSPPVSISVTGQFDIKNANGVVAASNVSPRLSAAVSSMSLCNIIVDGLEGALGDVFEYYLVAASNDAEIKVNY